MNEMTKQETCLKRFVRKWQSNPLYSTGAVLILMILVLACVAVMNRFSDEEEVAMP